MDWWSRFRESHFGTKLDNLTFRCSKLDDLTESPDVSRGRTGRLTRRQKCTRIWKAIRMTRTLIRRQIHSIADLHTHFYMDYGIGFEYIDLDRFA